MAGAVKPATTTTQGEHVETHSSSSEHHHDADVIEKQPQIGGAHIAGDNVTGDAEKTAQKSSYIPQNDEDYIVTWKTWVVVWILSWSYGISFWIVPSVAACAATVATDLGDVTRSAWYISTYTMTVAIGFMICGANSDLFGRRWFLVGGNVLMFVGFILGGAARNNAMMIAAFAFIGFGAGNAQLAAFALPELLPNKWRHIAVVIADVWVIVAAVIGPVAGRFAGALGKNAWQWLFYAPAILTVTSFVGLFLYYFPPAHPRGLPTAEAFRQLDYGGGVLFIVAATLILTGINYTTVLPSSDPMVIGTLAGGFGVLVIFILYERYMPLKQPLTPTHVFTRNKGRALTAPFIAAFVVTMFYYMVNVVYPTMINVFYSAPGDYKYQAVLTLPGNLGLATGAALLAWLGTRVGHWRWQLVISVGGMVLFGALLALGNPGNMGTMIAMVFLCQVFFGWAQYLSIAYVQFGCDQVELGISGGLAGVARFAGGAVAISVYTAILTNVQSANYKTLVPAAATGAGLPESSVAALLAALPLGAEALSAVPGLTTEIAVAAGAAFQESYVYGLRTTALSSLAFGILGVIAAFFCEDIGHKMNDKIEIYLENDAYAERNVYH